MYHSNIKNQDFSTKKSSLFKGFLSKDLQTYMSFLTPFEYRIAQYLLKFRKQYSQRLCNTTIAYHVRCSVKTVTRATNKFHRDGFITKRQSHTYDINAFSFHEKTKKGTSAFNYWFNELPSHLQDTYISHGVVIDHKNKKIVTSKNVPLYLSSSLKQSLFKNSSLLFVRARERGPDFSKKIKEKTMEHPKKSNSSPEQFVFKEKIGKKPESLLTIRAKREDLLKKIEECKRKIADPHKYVKFGVIEASVVYFQKELQEHIKHLTELEEQINEKQNILHQYKSHILGAYSS